MISPSLKQQWSPSRPVAGLGTALQAAGQTPTVTEQEAILSDFPPLPFSQSGFLKEIRFRQSLCAGRSLTDVRMHMWTSVCLTALTPSQPISQFQSRLREEKRREEKRREEKRRESRHLGRWKFHESRLQHTEQCLPRGTGYVSYWMPVKSQRKNRAAALLPTGKPPARGHSQPKMTGFLPLKCSEKSLHWIHRYYLSGALNRADAFHDFFVLI